LGELTDKYQLTFHKTVCSRVSVCCVFNQHFFCKFTAEYVSRRVLEVGQYLTKLWLMTTLYLRVFQLPNMVKSWIRCWCLALYCWQLFIGYM